MKSDIKISEAVTGLHNPKKYLNGVLAHMRSCSLAYGNAFLRLGTSAKGTGKYPSYRVVYHKDGKERIFGSFVDSHKIFPEPYDKITPGDWSTVASEINEVMTLEASLTGK